MTIPRYDTDSRGISYTGGFFMLIGFVVIGLILAALISIPVWSGMTGTSFEHMQDEMNNPGNGNAAKVIQAITAVVGFLLPTLFTARILNRRPMQLLGYKGKVSLTLFGIVFVLAFCALFLSGFFSWLNERIPISDALKMKFDSWESDYNGNVEAIIGLNSPLDFALAIIVMAFLPALCEETLFRGGLQNFLTRATRMPWLSIIFVSILFSAAHLSYYGFLSRFALGVLLGLIYQFSGRIWLNIFAHFLNNAIAITALYIMKLQGKPLHDAINDNSSTYWGIVVLPLVVFLLVLIKRHSPRPPEAPATFAFEKPESDSHGL